MDACGVSCSCRMRPVFRFYAHLAFWAVVIGSLNANAILRGQDIPPGFSQHPSSGQFPERSSDPASGQTVDPSSDQSPDISPGQSPDRAPVQAPIQVPGQVVLNPAGQCVEPPPMVRLQDYNGPFNKIVGTFTRKIDRQSVREPHYKQGAVLCSLEIKDKFFLFLRDSVDPETFLAAGFDAGLAQAEDQDPTFGQGGMGYAKRVGVTYMDEVQYRFFKEFAYTTIFSEDPRYYRMGQGASAGRRFLHAVAHSIVANNDNGRQMFNFSEWMGEVSAISISHLYHPGARRGFGPATESLITDVSLDVGYDELREFWPEIAKKFKLPFRYENEPAPDAVPAGR